MSEAVLRSRKVWETGGHLNHRRCKCRCKCSDRCRCDNEPNNITAASKKEASSVTRRNTLCLGDECGNRRWRWYLTSTWKKQRQWPVGWPFYFLYKWSHTQRTEGWLNLNFQAHPYGVTFLNPWNMPKYPIKTLNLKIDIKALNRAIYLSFFD